MPWCRAASPAGEPGALTPPVSGGAAELPADHLHVRLAVAWGQAGHAGQRSCVSTAERRKVVRGKPPIGFCGDAVAKEEYAIVLYQARHSLVSLLQTGTATTGEWVGGP